MMTNEDSAHATELAELAELDHQAPALSESLGWFGKLDRAVYGVEVVTVVLALVIMSVIVFTDVVYGLTLGLEQSLDTDPTRAWGTIAALGAFVWVMAYAATSRRGRLSREAAKNIQQRPFAVRAGLASAFTGAALGAAFSLLHFESSTVYRIVTLLLAIPVLRYFWLEGLKGRAALFIVATAAAVGMMGGLPEGYSWAQSYGLFLLLWVGFLGGSIAARERRHLRIDLMRKLLPPKWLPHFNALSYLVAAAFTAVVLYLGWLYLFGPDSSHMAPIWDSPDWLEVLAIPVSMALIVMRFVGHSIAFGRMALRGEEFEEVTEAH